MLAMYLKKTPNLNGRIRLSIVDTYYDKAKKCSRQKSSYDDRNKENYGRDTSLIYYDEVLKDIGRVTDIDFGKRIRTLGEIKKVLAKTQK